MYHEEHKEYPPSVLESSVIKGVEAGEEGVLSEGVHARPRIAHTDTEEERLP